MTYITWSFTSVTAANLLCSWGTRKKQICLGLKFYNKCLGFDLFSILLEGTIVTLLYYNTVDKPLICI